MRSVRILLIIIAVACFAVALSYPIRYRAAQDSNNSEMDELAALRSQIRTEEGVETPRPAADEPEARDTAPAADLPAQAPDATDARPQQETPAGQGAAAANGEDSQPPTEREGDLRPGQGTPEEPEQNPSGAEPSNGQQNPSGAEPSNGQEQGPSEVEPVNGQEQSLSEAESANGQAQGTSPEAQPERSDIDAGNGQTSSGGAQAPGDGGDQSPSDPERETDVSQSGPLPAGEDQPAGATVEAGPTPPPTPVPTPSPEPGVEFYMLEGPITPTPEPSRSPTPVPTDTPVPTPTPDRTIRTGPLPYPLKEKVELDETAILPELREIYALNHDLAGWIEIPGTVVNYPVVQREDGDYYLEHDFYGQENINGQIILDSLCDPYTPSYNLIISGHHMKNGSMFGGLPDYRTRSYWERHKFVEFDTLMERKQYVVFAAFYSADYDEDEEGFRYNANIQYAMEVKQWLAEIRANQLYDTGIDAEFGDEFITLTTCNRARHRNGRFVVVCRRIREGETFE